MGCDHQGRVAALYGVFGISAPVAWRTMPLVGAIDITLGAVVLLSPFRALLAHLILWTIFTAVLRPAAGMGWWEFLERGGNYGPPIALFVLASEHTRRWFARIEPRDSSQETLGRVAWILRASIAFLLIGHGGFALFQEKAALIQHWRSIGIPANRTFLHFLGAGEIVAGVAVLLRPARSLLVAVALWKIANELLYPVSGVGRDIWEWIERSGDYLAPLALISVFVLRARAGTVTPSFDARAETSSRRPDRHAVY